MLLGGLDSPISTAFSCFPCSFEAVLGCVSVVSGVVRVYVGFLGFVVVLCGLFSGAYRVVVFGWFVTGLLSWFGYFTPLRGDISQLYTVVIGLLGVAWFFEGFAIVVGYSPAICFVRYCTHVERGYFSTLYI